MEHTKGRRCEGRVPNKGSRLNTTHQCEKPATTERDGTPLCRLHAMTPAERYEARPRARRSIIPRSTTTPETQLGLATYKCGCRVTGVQADRVKAIVYASGVTIEWCPTHQQAPAMLEALRETLRALEAHLDADTLHAGLKHREQLCPCHQNEVARAKALLDSLNSDPKGR